ncbi:MAG: thiamine phosphate synthase, partial [Clostridium sp.]
MKLDKKSMLLYIVTNRSWLGNNNLSDQVKEIIESGGTFIQLREKDLPFNKFVALGKQIKEITDKYSVPFVINDNIEVAIQVDADGVHVGQSDMNVEDVRHLIGPNKILGVSAQTVNQAISAEKQGADYIGVGAVFTTSTKKDADTVTLETLKEICNNVSIPVIAIGGINENNILELRETGISGVAVISAIFAKPSISLATKELLELSKIVEVR